MAWRVLVTGSEGFVGQHLCAALETDGHEVIGCGLDIPKDTPTRYACDLTDALATFNLLDRIEPPTHVVHLAAITFLPDASRNPDKVIDANVGGLTNLLAAIAGNGLAPRILFVSSCQAYGIPQSLPITEDHPLHSDHPYGVSKRLAEETCQTLIENEGLDVVVARPFNHTGPGHRPDFALSSFARQIAQIERGQADAVLKVGNLESKRDYLHVQDVVTAYRLLLEQGECGQAYNVCRGRSEKMRDMLDTLVSMSSRQIEIVQDPERTRTDDIPDLYGSHAKLSAATGWEPDVSIQEMLAGLLEYWRKSLT